MLVMTPSGLSCSSGRSHARFVHYFLCERLCKRNKPHHIWILIGGSIGNPTWILHNSNASQAFPITDKSAKLAKTTALFHFRSMSNWVCLPYLRQKLKSTWSRSLFRHAYWLRLLREHYVSDRSSKEWIGLLTPPHSSPRFNSASSLC